MNEHVHDSGQVESHAAGGAGPVTTSATPPRALADIPGLGPIRVRALEKAGWGDLSALRSADLEQLLAVPGLTEIKARHIQQFLAPFTAEQLLPLPAEGDVVVADSTLPAGLTMSQRTGYVESSSGAAQVVQRATRAMGEVITVLLSPEAPQFRSRLLRILGQFSQCAESLATDAAHLSADQQARAIRRLRRAAKVVSELNGSTAADKKAQGRLADALEELNTKLAECRLSN